ncbi:sugar ABC transporter ATP-binding protein [Enterocloster bolteae]|uniref:sugar ABC transporter ATP-binding protein n=1 Tax=Enterocloster bolteae TaxID=208479 RepID=UPI002903E0E7|nr:sugar ABC transporter ATP-binding protein [Enterocloster bolteae]MDU1139180.1 sugar ABC transporter ATP-binding protein [Enterocloster bolteae]
MATMIHFSNITKQFPGNKALDSVDFTVDKGEIHALLGENGAGKSTLLNILHGIYPDYDGNVEIDGRKVGFKNANDAIEFGIAKVHQEVNLVTELTVGQNIALGYEVTRGFFVDYDSMYKKTDVILEKLGCKFRSRDRVTSLSTGEMQMILIAKALFHNAKIISFDEPTSALTDREVDRLLKMIMELKDQGITILYITHRLDEVFAIADRASILRDGTYITTLNMKETYPLCAAGEVVLEARDLCKNGVFEHISFELHRGEILSFAGLVGSKRTDVMRAIFGADPYTSGEVYIKGKRAEIKSPKDALQYSLGLIPENRKTQGFVKNFTNASNMALASMNRFCSRGFVNARKIYDNCMYYTGEMNLHPADPDYLTESLSGGNAQKVIIAKWMTTDADIIIFDEPTKGIDVGAKAEIYRLMEELVAGGKSIIMVSSELPEVIGMSDRVVVMREGKIMGVLNHDELNEEVIMSFAMGG